VDILFWVVFCSDEKNPRRLSVGISVQAALCSFSDIDYFVVDVGSTPEILQVTMTPTKPGTSTNAVITFYTLNAVNYEE